MADFGFVGGAYESPSIYQDTQELINWYCELDPAKEGESNYAATGQQITRGVIALYPTPGYTLQIKLPITAEVRGMHPCGNILLAACGNKLYSIDSTLNYVERGTLLSDGGPVSMDDNGIGVLIVDGSNRYTYSLTTNAFAHLDVSDGAFMGGDKVYCVDNYLIYNRPNSQQWAATTALSTSTPALSFSSKDGAPDNLMVAMVSNRDVYLLGEKTSEVWVDVGTFPFAFQRIPGSNTQHGCAAKHSVSRLGDSFAFLSRDERGQGIIVAVSGYAFQRISTHAIENDILGLKLDDAIAFTYQMEGHEFYVLTLPTADKTWVYDLSTNKWHKWLSVDSHTTYHRHRANCHAVFQGMNLIGDYNNGAIYSLSNAVYTDNGTNIRRVRRCPHIVGDFKRQFLEELQIAFQPGVGSGNDQGYDPKAMLRWSNDGGSTWSREQWKSIGKIGRYKHRAIWRRMGVARDRVYELVITDPIKAVIISANLIGSGGDH